jgi:hypothetical protein
MPAPLKLTHKAIAPAHQPRRAVPARQHHHRLCLAHRPVRTSAPANARHHGTTPPGRLKPVHQARGVAREGQEPPERHRLGARPR